jgi:hypothetical protein
MRRYPAGFLAGAVALSLSLVACATEAPVRKGLKDAVALSYERIPLSQSDRKEHRVGRLLYRGGIEISSSDRRFGGWSGLVVSADGTRMLTQSDKAHWLRADLVYGTRGNLAGIANAQLADMRNRRGRRMAKRQGDAEGLVALTRAGPDGPVLVSFERIPRVWSYDLSHSLDARPEPVSMPDGIKTLRGSNQGLEGLTILRPGAVLAVSEAPHETRGEMDAWLVPYPTRAAGIVYGALKIKRHPPYEISDAAMGPDGKYLYLLERHYYGMVRGVAIAVRRIRATDVRGGATLGGQEIAEFSVRENIDNMEGLALRRSSDGKTYLYMISDDNYSPLQRTLLLMFELVAKAQ